MATKEIIYFTAGVVVGGTSAYFITKKMLETDLQAQIDDVKEHYKLIRKDGEYSSPENVPTYYQDTLEGMGYSEEGFELSNSEAEELKDILDDDVEEAVDDEDESDDVLYSEDEATEDYSNRFEEEPYIIPVKEFMYEKEDYDKITVTYFENDDTLCDEREQLIPDIEGTVGSDALTKFGRFSDDKNIVYVRNDNLKTDFEVLLDKRSFSEVVLGIREEKFIRKMRDDD